MFDLSFKTKGVLSIFGGFCIHLMLGVFYVWGNLTIYFSSYFLHTETSPTYSIIIISIMIGPTMDLISTCSMFIAVPVSNKLTTKLTIFIFGSIMSMTPIIVSFTTTAITFMLIYCPLMGFSYGLIWMGSLNNIFKFFPDKKGLCSGVILSGIGIGAAIGNLIAQKSVNPDNVMPIDYEGFGRLFESSISMNFPFGLRVLGIYFFGLTCFGTLITFNYHHDEHVKSMEIEIAASSNSEYIYNTPKHIKTINKYAIYTGLSR
jgi:MFS transporter, OFA family, oxalate/formate antiporter